MDNPCPLCDGTTFTRHVREDGRSVVTRCECSAKAARDVSLEEMGVPGRYLECAFDERSGGRQYNSLTPSLDRPKRVVERWADQFPDVDAGLLLSGPPGVGKTHLGVAILRRIVMERRIAAKACFVDYRSLLREIKRTYHPDTSITESQVLRPILEAEPLVLDDLGGENSTLWVFDTLFYILNQRYNEKKLTVITTNFADSGGPVNGDAPPVSGGLRPKAAEPLLADRVTVRLRSRLFEMCRDVRIAGDDYRKSVLQANFTV